MQSSELDRAPYGRQSQKPQTTDPREDGASSDSRHNGETYYGRPVLKPSHYGQLIASYLFIGGIAGASQMIATIADWCGDSEFIVRAGRYLSFGSIAAAPFFLIADLRTPERWYNMLRIFRRTSTMSIGAWTLTGFGAGTGITTALQFFADRLRRPAYRHAARVAALPATAAGAVVATYTGTLLGATSTPLWARANRFLPALFGISAVATSTAALSLAAHTSGASERTKCQLNKLALISAGAELVVSSAVDRHWQREKLRAPLNEQPIKTAYHAGYKTLGIAVPLILHGLGSMTGRRSSRSSIAAAAATLLGGYVLRSIIVHAGKGSAKRPEDYFTVTQAE